MAGSTGLTEANWIRSASHAWGATVDRFGGVPDR